MRAARAGLVILAAVGAVAACGDDGGGGRGTLAERCAQACACGPTGADFCAPDCPMALAPLRSEGVDYLVARACAADGAVVAPPPSRAADEAFQRDCLAKRGACGGSLRDDLCIVSELYPDAAVSAASACLAGSCDTVQACVVRAFPSS